MSVTTRTTSHGAPWDEAPGADHDLVAELRDVDHWRRLVAARLDLAVAAVTDVDELAGPAAGGFPPPSGLRRLVGLPPGEQAGAEVAVLPRLRSALAALDAYAAALRPRVGDAVRASPVPGTDVPARPA